MIPSTEPSGIGRWWICHQLRTPRRILRKETALLAPSCGLLPLQTLNLSRSDLEAFPLIDRSSIADSGVWFPWFSKLGFFKAVYYLTQGSFVSAFHTHTLFNVKFVSALYHFCFALTFLRTCLLVLLYSAPIISLPEVSGAQGRYIHKLVCTSYAHRPPAVDIGIHPCVIWLLFLCCLEPPALHVDRASIKYWHKMTPSASFFQGLLAEIFLRVWNVS